MEKFGVRVIYRKIRYLDISLATACFGAAGAPFSGITKDPDEISYATL
jgi:hypothetical protein